MATAVLTFPVNDPPTTVAGVIALYLQLTRHEQSPENYANKVPILHEFAAVYPTMAVGAAKPFHLRHFVNSQTERWKSAWTRRGVFASVRGAFGWAVREGYIAANPFAGVTCEPGNSGDAIEADEIPAMLRATTAAFRRVIIFCRYSGCRPGEMKHAEWPNYDIVRSCLVIWKHKTVRKTRKPRQIILHPCLVKLLEWIRRHRPHERLIFTNSRGGQWTNTAICQRIKEIRARTKIRGDVTLYHFRHGFLTEGVLKGLDVATLAELAGHESIRTTQTYLHLAKHTGHLRDAVAKIFRNPH